MASEQSAGVSKKKRWKKKTKPYNTPKPEDLELLIGRWKLSSIHYEPYDACGYVSEEDFISLENGIRGVNLPECEGVEVVFDDQCDITWSLPKGVEPIPLFLATSFSIDKDTIDLIGGEDGRTFRFLVDVGVCEDQLILKTLVSNWLEEGEEEEEGEMVIVIHKVSSTSEVVVDNFTLKEALDNAFFSDLILCSSDSVSFPVHRVVLTSSSCRISFRDFEILASGLKASLVKVILEFVYTDSLPTQLSLSCAKELSAAISSMPKLSHLHGLCQAFINSNNLKQRLMGLVDGLQSTMEYAKHVMVNTEMSNPAKIMYSMKQLSKEAVAGAAKFGLLCELYNRNKKEMTKKEKQEVLDYVRGRVVVFVDLLSELIEIATAKLNVLSDSQKMETAAYIVPEVERIWDLVNVTSKEAEAAMVAKVESLGTKGVRCLKKHDIKVAILLQFISKGRELRRLRKIGKEFVEFVEQSHRRREEFKEWTDAEKTEKIIRFVTEGLEGEGTNQIDQLAELKKDILIENALDWKKFKLLVTICCTYLSWGFRKVQGLKVTLRPALLKACKFVQRPEVNETLLYLDILDETDLAELREDDQEDGPGKTTMPGLWENVVASESQLAQGCHKFLSSQDYSDMKFVVMPHISPDSTPGSLDGLSCGVYGEDDTEGMPGREEGVVIAAHRVIVAARCEYFKRALQSGMKEAIDRCIVIHDCDVSVFRTFLSYLYGGVLATASMSLDDIVELLMVADRYETTSLRGLCEALLVERVKDASVFSLLQVADRYSARKLREATLHHIIGNSDLMMSEIESFYALPEELREEIRSITNSTNPQLAIHHSSLPAASLPKSLVSNDLCQYSSSISSNNSSVSSSGSSSTVPLTSSLDQGPVLANLDGYSHDVCGMFNTPQSIVFQEALVELRSIVGDEASEDALKEYLLAADMDVNRALNFYFS